VWNVGFRGFGNIWNVRNVWYGIISCLSLDDFCINTPCVLSSGAEHRSSLWVAFGTRREFSLLELSDRFDLIIQDASQFVRQFVVQHCARKVTLCRNKTLEDLLT